MCLFLFSSEKAWQTAPSHYENHGLCADSVQTKSRSKHAGPRTTLPQAILGGGSQTDVWGRLPTVAAQLQQGKQELPGFSARI